MSENKKGPKKVDLSKLSNLEAIAPKDDLMKKALAKKTSGKKRNTGKFNFAEAELVDLPSRGILYKYTTEDENILNGKIELYPMTAREEEILSTQKFIRDGSATRRVLNRCIASDIDAKDILTYDSNYLLFFLRQISYGDKYEFELKCQNSICGKKFNHSLNISELEFEDLPDVEEPIEVKLARSKYTVNMVLPRLYHTEEIISMNANKKKTTEDSAGSQIDRYIVTTVSIIDPSGEEIDKKDWREFFEALPGGDIAAIREASDYSTGVDTLEGVVCPYCETDYSGTIPIGINFFRF